jgi:hypothetical protein
LNFSLALNFCNLQRAVTQLFSFYFEKADSHATRSSFLRQVTHTKRKEEHETLDRVSPRVLVPDLGFHVLFRFVLLLLQSVQEKVEEETVVAELIF